MKRTIILPDEEHYGLTLRRRKGCFDKTIIHETAQNYYSMPSKIKTVIDIGAHIGMFSLMAVKAKDGASTVYAFEPEKSSFKILTYNVKRNNAQDKIRCINKGVGKPGRTKLYTHPTNSGMATSFFDPIIPSSGPRAGVGFSSDQYQVVNFISIKDVFTEYNIEQCELLKMDCEGSELDIINDIDDNIANRISQISVEIHDPAHVNQIREKLGKWFPIQGNPSSNIWVFQKG